MQTRHNPSQTPVEGQFERTATLFANISAAARSTPSTRRPCRPDPFNARIPLRVRDAPHRCQLIGDPAPPHKPSSLPGNERKHATNPTDGYFSGYIGTRGTVCAEVNSLRHLAFTRTSAPVLQSAGFKPAPPLRAAPFSGLASKPIHQYH